LLQKLLVFVYEQLSHGVTIDQLFGQLFAKQRGVVLV
jgi:hypothetical protein